jgi:4-hydroxyproline epimerase
VTLAYLGRIGPGEHRIETPAGIVTATLTGNSEVSVRNVPSWRECKDFTVSVPGVGAVTGDIAYGGNWFFLTEVQGQELSLAEVTQLSDLCERIRRSVNSRGYPQVDHIEMFGAPRAPEARARNFVLCPGGAYDRSPCGTGTSAKLACLAADGKLLEGAAWVQESILGSTFKGSYRWIDRASGRIEPVITGTAFVTAEATLMLDERDPLCWGVGRGA